MDYKRFFLALKERSLPACLLLDGEEEYVKLSALAQLRQAFLAPGAEVLDESVLPERAGFAQISEACETLPFLSEKRLVLVKESPLCQSSGRGGEEDADRLCAYLDSLPETTLLIFVVKGGADMRKKLPKKIAAQKGDVRFSFLAPREQAMFVQRQMGAFGKRIAAEAMEELLLRAGPPLERLEGESAKLAHYLGERQEAALEDVETIVARSAESTAFQMLDALLQRRAKPALSMLEELRARGESGFGILALLTGQLRRMLHLSLLMGAGLARGEAAQSLSLSPYVAGKVAESARGYAPGQLKVMLARCIETEYALKSGRLREEGAIEALLLAFLA
ncbi:MAG: DNA polymerase III subunit delta [Christensenellaceae bacterium]|jgi:DNA polymerase-3 subunit delta|nr:DNA polymerase III subunit delta [Christensenellaceae bacterium]